MSDGSVTSLGTHMAMTQPEPAPVSSATLQPAPLSSEQTALAIDLLARRIDAIEATLNRVAPSDRTNQPDPPWRKSVSRETLHTMGRRQ